MTKKTATPQLRFAGFDDAWEQRKLGELLQTLPFKSFLKEPEQDGKYEIIQQGNEPIIGFANGIPCNDYEDTVIFGDHTLSLYKPKRPFFVATDGVRIIKGKEKIDGFYLMALLEKYKPQSEGYKRYYGILSDSNCYITRETVEQKQIGGFFCSLDNLIALHQRKYDKLTNVKKSMLEKMFPKNGSNVPEIRFKGFAEAWEQRKLSDLTEKTYGGGTPATTNEAFWNGTIPWIQSSDITDGKLFGVAPRKYITNEALNKSATQLVPENSIAIITRVGVGKLAFMPFSYTTSQDFLSLSKLNTEPFFTVYACYKKLQSELNAVQGTSIKGITKDELLAKAIMVPKYREQEQIGSFFRSIDTLITLHQRELEKLKNFKKACLEKMFV